MVALVTGNSLGLSLVSSSANGQSSLGRANEQIYVNTATGNLVVQGSDEYLASVGLDTALIRTYNSQGVMADDNGDNWQLNVAALLNRPTSPNTAGSTVTKRFGDGAQSLYTFDGTKGLYVSTDGAGADDTLGYNAATQQWTWTDGDSRRTETYNSTGQLINGRDADGNTSTYTYTGVLLTQIRDASGQDTFLDYTGNNLTKIRVVSQGATQTLTRYGYDTSNRLTSVTVDLTPTDNAVTDNKMYVTTYTYEGTSKRIATITQTDGTKLTFTYDSSGRVKTYTDALSQTTTLNYTGGTGTAVTANAIPGALTNPAWSVQSLRESLGVQTSDLQTAFDQNGNGMAVWSTASDVYVSTYTASSNTWSAATVLDTGLTGTVRSRAHVSMSANGNALVTWTNDYALYARRFSAGSWGAVTLLLNTDANTSGSPIGAINNNGQAMVSFVANVLGTNPPVANLYVARFNGTSWSAPLAVDDVGGANSKIPGSFDFANYQSLALDQNNNATLLWIQSRSSEAAASLFVSRYTASSNTWSTPSATTLESAATDVARVKFAIDQNGNGVALWVQAGVVYTKSYTASSNTWGTVTNLGTTSPAGGVELIHVNVSANGNALATWLQRNGATDVVMARRYIAGSWQAGSVVSNPGAGAGANDVGQFVGSINNNGDAVVVFNKMDNATIEFHTYANRFVGGAWQASLTRIDSNPNQVLSSSVIQTAAAIDASGNINALWLNRNGSDAFDSVYSSRFTNVAPYYTVVAGDTWSTIATKVYGTANAGSALQTALGNPALTVGAKLNVPASVTYTDPATIATQVDVVDSMTFTTSYRANAQGQLTEILSPTVGGARLSTKYQYDVRGNVIQVTDGLNQVTVFQYDANDNLILTRDAVGNTVTWTYSAANQKLTETRYLVPDLDQAGPVLPTQPMTTRYVYDAENHLRFTVSSEGRVTETRYDAAGNLANTLRYLLNPYNVIPLAPTTALTEAQLIAWVATQPLGYLERTDYAVDFRGQVQTATTYTSVNASGAGVVDGTESKTQFVYDQRGKLLKTISGKGDTTQYTYDGMGRVLTTIDALNRTTITSYDDVNAKTKVTLVNGLATTSTYDKAGRLISVVDTNAANTTLGTTQYFYDAENRLRLTQDPTGVRNFRFYDDAGRLVAQVDGTGSATEYRYNAANQVTRTIRYATALSAATQGSLVDATGKPTNVAFASIRPAPSGADTSAWRVYDAAGRLVKTVDAEGGVVDTVYDGASQQKQTIAYYTRLTADAISALGDAPSAATATVAGGANDRYTYNFYDKDGLLVGSIDGEGYLTEHVYNYVGHVVTDIRRARPILSDTATSAWQTRIPTWNTLGTGAIGNARPADHADDQSTFYFYNASGQLNGVVDAEKYLTEFVYDRAGNRAKTIRYATRLVNPFTTSSTVTLLRPQLNAEDQANVVAYDALNRIFQETTPEGTVTQYTYDNVGNLTRTDKALGIPETRTLQARYDLQGRLIGELTGEGSNQITAGMTQTQIDAIWRDWGVAHAYDAAGRRISTTDQFGNKTLFYYDADGRLTHTINALGDVAESQYNALGQLTATIRYATRVGSATLATFTGGLANKPLTDAILAITNAALDSKTSYSDTRATVSGGSFLWRTLATTDALGNVTTDSLNTFGERIYLAEYSTDPLDVSPTTGAKRQFLQGNSIPDRRGLVTATSFYGLLDNVTSTEIKNLTTVYDAFGRATSTTDTLNHTTAQTYDRLGRVVQTRDNASNLRSSTYDAFGRVLTHTDALNRKTTYVYNKSEKSVAVTTPEGITVKTFYNAHGQVQKVVDGNKQETTYTYDKNGNLLNALDPMWNLTSTEFDRAGRVSLTTDAAGKMVKLTYDAANRVLTRTVDPVSVHATNDNPAGLNLETKYEYDAKGNQIKVTDANGTVTKLEYDLKGQLLRQTIDPTGLNLITAYTYDGRGKTLTVTDANGTVSRYRYDSLGRRISETVAGTLMRQYQYDGNDHAVNVKDANGNQTRYVYDANDRLVYTVDATGAAIKINYDAEGQVTSTVTYVTRLKNFSTLPAQASLTDVQSRLTPDTVNDRVEYQLYDKDGRLTATINTLGEVVKLKYDANGNVIERYAHAKRLDMTAWTPGTPPTFPTADPRDQRTRTLYDLANRPVYTVTDVSGGFAVSEQRYDRVGNVIERLTYSRPIPAATAVTDIGVRNALVSAADAARDLRVRMVYDNAGRLTHTVNGAGAVTQQFYDKVGNVTKTVEYATAIGANHDPKGVGSSPNDRVTIFGFDRANRQVYSLDSLGGLKQKAYDKNGNVVQFIAYAKSATVPDSSTTHTMTSLAALVTASMASDVNNRVGFFTYDSLSRITLSVDSTGGVVKTDYDAAGNAVQITAYAKRVTVGDLTAANAGTLLPGRVVPFETDTSHNRVTKYQYDAVGRQLATMDALGYVTDTVYTATGQVERTTKYFSSILTSTAPKDIVATASTTQTYGRRVTSFTYDSAGRLLTSTDALNFTESYTYDGVGNKRTFSNKKNSTWTYDYDAAGRLTQETSPQVMLTNVTQASDLAALQVGTAAMASIVTRFSYDALGNLRTRTEADGRVEQRTTTYEYDALGRQVKTIYPTVGVYNVNEDPLAPTATGLSVRAEVSKSLFIQTVYDTLGNAVSSIDVAGNRSYKVYNNLGQVAFTVDAMGGVTGYGHNSFGEVSQVTRYGVLTTLAANSATTSLTLSQVALTLAPLSHAQDRTLITDYDVLGRAVKVTEPSTFVYDADLGQAFNSPKVTRTIYNAFGEVFQVAQLKNSATNDWNYILTNYYDQTGNQVASVDALGYLTTQEFDSVGNVVKHTEYEDAYVTWSADGLTTIPWNGATPPIDPPTIGDGESTPPMRVTVYGYDLNDRKILETHKNVEYADRTTADVNNPYATYGIFTWTDDLTTTYGYDAVGNQTRVTDALGASTYTYYDALGRTLAVAAPAREALPEFVPPFISTPNAVATRTPLTEFLNDAVGNVVGMREYLYGAKTATEQSYTLDTQPGSSIVSTPSRLNLSKYNVLGYATQRMDAMGISQYFSYNEHGQLAKSWQSVTIQEGTRPATVSLAIPLVRTAFKVYQYDKLGRLSRTLDPGSAPIIMASDGVNYMPQVYSTLSMTYVGQTYNAFGEVSTRTQGLVSSSAPVDKNNQENFDYDNAGHLWRTNSGDGVWKVMLYDAQGRMTTTLVSATLDLSTVTSAEQAITLSSSNLRRTDTVYDAMGRVIKVTEPERAITQPSVSVSQVTGSGSIASSATMTPVMEEFNDVTDVHVGNAPSPWIIKWSGTNQVNFNLNLPPALSIGGGDFKVTVNYVTKSYTVAATSGNNPRTGASYTIPGFTHTGVARSVTQFLAAGANKTLTWTDVDGVEGGIGSLTSITIYKRDFDGHWRLMTTQTLPAPSTAMNLVTVSAPADPSTTVQMQVDKGGVAVTLDLINYGDAFAADTKSLADGTYNYKVLATSSDGTTRTTATGTFTLSRPTLASITTPITMGSTGTLTWQAPQGEKPTLNVKSPSASLWAALTPVIGTTTAGVTTWTADITGLGAGTFDYELLFTKANQVTPYTHATGQLTVVAAVSVPQSGTPPISVSLLQSPLALRWSKPANSDTQTVRYRTAGTTTWNTLSATPVGTTLPPTQFQANLPTTLPATYTLEVEVLFKSTSGATTARFTGRVAKTSSTATPALTNTTPPFTPAHTDPAQYSRTITTASNSKSVSLDGTGAAVTLTQAVATTMGSITVRPVINRTYDRWGNVLSVSDARSPNWVTRYSYNFNNQMTSVALPVGTANQYPPISYIFYDKVGRQVGTAERRAYTSLTYPTVDDWNLNTQWFNAAGQLIEENHADGGVVKNVYDLFGNRLRTTDAMGAVTDFTYDKLSRLTQIKHASVQIGGELFGNAPIETLSATTDTFVYDEMSNRISETKGVSSDHDGKSVMYYRYDVLGNVVETKNGAGERVRYAYDERGRKIFEIDQESNASSWAYDYFGRLKGHTDLGRALYAAWQIGVSIIPVDMEGADYSYTYNKAGQLTLLSNTRGENESYSYDAAGQLTYQYNGRTEARYAYDLAGHRVRETTRSHQDGAVYQDNHIAYDSQGRMMQVSDGWTDVKIDYDLLGNRSHIYTRVSNYNVTAEATEYTHRYFLYDKMNRQTTIDAIDAQGTLGTKGHSVTYDKNGNRLTDYSWGKKIVKTLVTVPNKNRIFATDPVDVMLDTYSLVDDYTIERYSYDSLNRLKTRTKDGYQLDYRVYDGPGRVLQTGMRSAPWAVRRDWAGYGPDNPHLLDGQVAGVTGTEVRRNYYDNAGRLSSQDVLDFLSGNAIYNGKPLVYVLDYDYDRAGNVLSYTMVTHPREVNNPASMTVKYVYTHALIDGYKEKTITASSLQTGTTGITTNTYDISGNLIGVKSSSKPEDDRTLVYSLDDTLLWGQQGSTHITTAFGQDLAIPNTYRQLVVNGQVLARYGVVIDESNPRDKKTNNPNFKVIADFNFGYQPINGNYPTAAPGAYSVRAGDTLQVIAQGAYGDASLWYIIADANGLAGNEGLRVGQTLTIPNRVGTSHNNSSNYRPYDQHLAIGDTTPFLPGKPGEAGCGTVGLVLVTIIAVAVAVVVTYFTAGALTEVVGPLAAAAIAAAAASVASQSVLMVAGVQKQFSWKQVAISSALAMVGYGFAAELESAGNVLAQSARGAFTATNTASTARTALSTLKLAAQNVVLSVTNNYLRQLANLALGEQDQFHWGQLAGAAVAGAAGSLATSGLGLAADKMNIPASFGRQLLTRFGSNFAAGMASSAIATWIDGGTMRSEMIAADSFGNALGNAIVGSIGRMQTERANQKAMADAKWFALKQQTNATLGLKLKEPEFKVPPRAVWAGDAPEDGVNKSVLFQSISREILGASYSNAQPSVAASAPDRTMTLAAGSNLTRTFREMYGRAGTPSELMQLAKYNEIADPFKVRAGATILGPDNVEDLASLEVTSKDREFWRAKAEAVELQRSRASLKVYSSGMHIVGDGSGVGPYMTADQFLGRPASGWQGLDISPVGMWERGKPWTDIAGDRPSAAKRLLADYASVRDPRDMTVPDYIAGSLAMGGHFISSMMKPAFDLGPNLYNIQVMRDAVTTGRVDDDDVQYLETDLVKFMKQHPDADFRTVMKATDELSGFTLGVYDHTKETWKNSAGVGSFAKNLILDPMYGSTHQANIIDAGGRIAHAKFGKTFTTMERGRMAVGTVLYAARAVYESIEIMRGNLNTTFGSTTSGSYAEVWGRTGIDTLKLGITNFASEKSSFFFHKPDKTEQHFWRFNGGGAMASHNAFSATSFATEFAIANTLRLGLDKTLEIAGVDKKYSPYSSGTAIGLAASAMTLGVGYGMNNRTFLSSFSHLPFVDKASWKFDIPSTPISWMYRAAGWSLGRYTGAETQLRLGQLAGR